MQTPARGGFRRPQDGEAGSTFVQDVAFLAESWELSLASVRVLFGVQYGLALSDADFTNKEKEALARFLWFLKSHNTSQWAGVSWALMYPVVSTECARRAIRVRSDYERGVTMLPEMPLGAPAPRVSLIVDVGSTELIDTWKELVHRGYLRRVDTDAPYETVLYPTQQLLKALRPLVV